MKTISQQIDSIMCQEVEPAIEILMTAVKDELEVRAHKANAIVYTKKEEEKIIDNTRDFFVKLMTGMDERHLIEEGFQLVLEMAKTFPGGQALLEDLRRAGERFSKKMEEIQEDPEAKPEIADTMQQGFGISDQTIQTIYQMGCDCFQKNETHKVQAIFSYLTCLNDFIFEAWLILGVAHKENKNYFSAMHALSMASLLNLHHPSPHLNSAEIYLLNGDKDLAQKTLDYCVSICSKQDLEIYQSAIESLRSKIKSNEQ